MDADLSRKLGLKEGQRVYLVNSPEGFREALVQASPRLDLSTRLGPGPADAIIAWPEANLVEMMQRLLKALGQDGSIWVVIPKKTSGLPGPSFEATVNASLPLGLVDNKSLTVSEKEYGIRFVIRRKLRKAPGQRRSSIDAPVSFATLLEARR